MRSPRWQKVLADLKISRSRTALVTLSIAVGVFAVGTMLTARVTMQRGVDDSFAAASAASAILMTEPFDQSLVEATRSLPEVDDAQGRANIPVRLRTGAGDAHNLSLSGIADFEHIRIDRFQPEDGAWPPATGELLLERLSRDAAGVGIGDTVDIEMPDGLSHALIVSGTVYDPGTVAPSISGDRLFGYVSLDTIAALGQPAAFNQMHVVAAENPDDLHQGELVAGVTRDLVLEPNGVIVHRIAVHDTPRYHAADLMDALILVLGVLGVLVLLLGAFLVVNTVSALLAQQVRQIGVMKAIGGQRRQIVLLYLALVLAFGAIAAIIAVPLAALAVWGFMRFFAGLLNFEVRGPWFPPSVVSMQLVIALLIPLAAALIPVLRGTRISVREALTSYGLSERPHRAGPIDRVIGWLPFVQRPMRLSLRNTFRKRGRLGLTLATLTLGGAIFASVTTIQSSLDKSYEQVTAYSNYDVEVDLRDTQPSADALRAAESVPGVDAAEAWIATNASRIRPDGTQNSNVWLLAPPAESDLVHPTLLEGRWFEPGEQQALVINVDFQRDEPDIQLGDQAPLRVEGRDVTWPVVGIVTTQLIGPAVFAPHAPLSEALGIPGEANRLVLVTNQHDADTQSTVAEAAEQHLRASGIQVEQVASQSDLRAGTESLFSLLVMMLFFVAGLLVLVGLLGLAGSMSLNVIERTREIGLMRAIGATSSSVARIVIAEGLVIGLLGWALGALLAVPMSRVLSSMVGNAFLQVPLAWAFSATGVLFWLVLVVVLSIIASLAPARAATRLSVREVLAYE
jgi:putative ABC transport system permease protein